MGLISEPIFEAAKEVDDNALKTWRKACEPYNEEIEDINAQDSINAIDISRMIDIKDAIDDVVYNKTSLVRHTRIRITQDGDKMTGIELEPPYYGDSVFTSFGG